MRLARWCESSQGHYALGLRQRRGLASSGSSSRRASSASTSRTFSIIALTRSPVTLYLFHVIRQLLDGRRFVCWMDEFWKLLADPAFEGFAKDGPKTWRKLNGVMCLATQSASDVLDESDQPHDHRADADQDPLSESRCKRERVHRRLRAVGARVQAAQRAARARLAAVPDQTGPLLGRLSARPQGVRRGAEGDLRPREHASRRCSGFSPARDRTRSEWLPDFPTTGDLSMKRWSVIVLMTLGALGTAPARAQFAVIDVNAIVQMAQQLRTLQDQLLTARNQLSQAEQQFQSLTGGRGMEQLLSGTVRNYLPTDWTELDAALHGVQTAVRLARRAARNDGCRRNAVLTAAQTARWMPAQVEQLDAARRSVALQQVMSRQALQNSSQRFDVATDTDQCDPDGDGREGHARSSGPHRGRGGDAPKRAHETHGAASDRRGRGSRARAARPRARGREHRFAAPCAARRASLGRHADDAVVAALAAGSGRVHAGRECRPLHGRGVSSERDLATRRSSRSASTIRARWGRAPIASTLVRPSGSRVAGRCAISRQLGLRPQARR